MSDQALCLTLEIAARALRHWLKAAAAGDVDVRLIDETAAAFEAELDRTQPEPPAVPYARQLACAERELSYRRRMYPRWVKEDKMAAHTARDEIDAMAAVVVTLHALADAESGQGRLL